MKKFDFLGFTTFVEQISASEVDFLDIVSTNDVYFSLPPLSRTTDFQWWSWFLSHRFCLQKNKHATFGRFHQTLGYYTPSLLHKQSSFHRMHSSGRVFDSFIPSMDGEDQVTIRCCQILWNPSRLWLGFGILRKSKPFIIRVWRARGEHWRPGLLRTCFPLSVLLFEGAGCVRGGSGHPRSPQWCMSASTATVRLCNFEKKIV